MEGGGKVHICWEKIPYFKMFPLFYCVVGHNSHFPALILGSFVLVMPSGMK